MQEENGAIVTHLDRKWSVPKMSDPKDHRVAFPGKHVIEKRHAQIEAPTGNSMFPNLKTDVTYLKFEDSETGFKVLLGSSTQSVLDCYTSITVFEAHTVDPCSNQVIF